MLFTCLVFLQLFPYHLSEYVCRVLRVTPFRYYCDLLYTVMREEKSYDQIPNFAVRPESSSSAAYVLHFCRFQPLASCEMFNLVWDHNRVCKLKECKAHLFACLASCTMLPVQPVTMSSKPCHNLSRFDAANWPSECILSVTHWTRPHVCVRILALLLPARVLYTLST